MAKKPKKAPEGEAAAEAPKSKKKLIAIAAAAVLALGAGAGGYMLTKKKPGHDVAHGTEQADAHGGGHDGGNDGGHGSHGEAAQKAGTVFLDVRDFVVNLQPEPGQTKSAFLKVRIALELKDPRIESEVKPLLPRVEDTFQTFMRELRASDVAGSVGLYRLREELLRRINIAIHPAKVEAVLFKDIVVQ